ncbi:hypothetical protein DXM22_22795 [Agrobacterium vitis]|nr:hypothetical protein DXM22_22795 [Agrobacterium vitis]RCU54829.1 hypothetical protein ASB66_007400 [Agrobacterium vitis]
MPPRTIVLIAGMIADGHHSMEGELQSKQTALIVGNITPSEFAMKIAMGKQAIRGQIKTKASPEK